MKISKASIRYIPPHGGMATIVRKFGITHQAVSQALRVARPGNPVVQEAIKMAKESGAVVAAKFLANIKAS